MADRDVLPRTPRTPRLSSRLVALPEPDAPPSASDSALSLTQYRCEPLDLDQLTSILSVEEQRIQNELLESEELFLHDVHGISAGGPGTDVLRCVHLLTSLPSLKTSEQPKKGPACALLTIILNVLHLRQVPPEHRLLTIDWKMGSLRKKWSKSFAGSCMCSNLFLRFENIGLFLTFVLFCFCVCKVLNKAYRPPLPTRLLCLVVAIPLVC